jgi:hypothetical protein
MLTFAQLIAICCLVFVMGVILMVIASELLKQIIRDAIEKYHIERDAANKKATRRALKMTKKMLED